MRIITVNNEVWNQGWINNRGDFDPRLFQWSYKFLLNTVLSIIMVNDDIRSQGWIDNRGGINPHIFENLHFLPRIGLQPGCLRQIPCLFLHLCHKKYLSILYKPQIILELLIFDIIYWPNFLIRSSSMDQTVL